ncbi:lipase family protein [Hoyosella sp. YIM 151337]|uniref:lipase family protein n=1 Tax=Hoyosella sp. YIM 151337 TaxID=2992742 RepID=UPI0022359DF0|nr:lipase family protein [Hoyosella sp. YIM 151337]MCW4354143.1 lipase family protein [Hoyosella sp. YIM 151337]
MSQTLRRATGALLTLILAVLLHPTVAAAEPPPPPDSFYDRPAGLSAYSPGDVIRSRPVDVRALQLFPVNVAAWHVMYRTTDADGNPDAAVTTIMVPRGGSEPRPLLSYQAATDSTLRVCGPSYSLVHGAPIDFTNPVGPVTLTLPAAELALAAAGLAEGWAVAMPDHGSLADRFLTPHQPGYAVLDGIRAVTNFEPAGLQGPSTPTALWGYSGGAIASSWAIEEHPSYAPELNIQGAAFGAPERDLEASLKSANRALLGGLIPIALAAIGKDSPEFATELDQYLTPQGRNIVAQARNHCASQNVLNNLWFDYEQHLNTPVEEVLANPVIRREIDARGVTGRAPTVPTYVHNGISEEVAPIVGTDRLVNSYCAGGTPVTYRREAIPHDPPPQLITTHGVIAVSGSPGAFHWLKQRLTPGAPAPASGCDIQDVPSTLVEPGVAETVIPSFVETFFAMVSGQPI